MHYNIVLHDDGTSTEDVLCGPKVLTPGTLGSLTGQDGDDSLPYYFIAKLVEKPADSNGTKVSVHSRVAVLFGFRNHALVCVESVQDETAVTATHLELTFRDQHLSRADMWRITSSSLHQKTIYKGQKLVFLDSIKATVKSIFIKGKEVPSAYTTSRSKPIFRSESARFVIYLQMSREMWEWDEPSGKLMIEKVVDGFLPELFERWEQTKARHAVSVILFGRHSEIADGRLQDSGTLPITPPARHSDFYQVVVHGVPSSHWKLILKKTRKACKLYGSGVATQSTFAKAGDLLQSISLLSSSFNDPYTDQDLARTGFSVIIVTAGSGIFESDYVSLRMATELLTGNGTGVDIVSVAVKPLHPVPIFSYTDPIKDTVLYALPHWADISYYTDSAERSSTFQPSFRLDAPSNLCNVTIPHFDVKDLKHIDDSALGAFRPRTREIMNITRDDLAPSESLSQKPRSDNDRPAVVQPTYNRHAKPALQRRVLMPRQISLGAQGLGVSKGLASTTVSIEHAQNARAGQFATNETSSVLARQIRASLGRRASQQSLNQAATESTPTSHARPAEKDNEQFAVPAPTSNDLVHGDAQIDTLNDSLRSTAESPWLTLSDPCHPKKGNMRFAPQHRHWQNVYPKLVPSKEFKWASMCSPAALPLTNEYSPLAERIRSDFDTSTHCLSTSDADEASNIHSGLRIAMGLIAFRLAHGFQFIRSSHTVGQLQDYNSLLAALSIPTRAIGQHGMDVEVFMALGDTIHELRFQADADIEVTVHKLRITHDPTAEYGSTAAIQYSPYVRTSLSQQFTTTTYRCTSSGHDLKWEDIDRSLAAKQDHKPAELGSWRARFVLIPVDPPRAGRGTRIAGRGLSDEERRLDAIQRLTQAWQRARHFSSEDKQNQASLHWKDADPARNKDANPLAIDYQTIDPSAVVHAYGAALTEQLQHGEHAVHFFSESDMYHSSEFDVMKIAQHLQEPPPRGVPMKNRRWYTKHHLQCFRGDEMTNWVLKNFKDVNTRDEAVQLGDVLMKRGLFTHVVQKHDFRDGNYFYQISGQYRTSEYPDTAGFFNRRTGKSVPSTPVLQAWRDVSTPDRSEARRVVARTSESSGEGVPINKLDRPKLELTRLLRYNVDSSHKSRHEEVIDLHYDRIHNPENCYHIRLEWTSATSRLVEDAISRWANLVEKDGLKLVEVPIPEASAISQTHPLEIPHRISLASQPLDAVAASPLLNVDHAHETGGISPYLRQIMRHHNFVLDFGAAAAFATAAVEAVYSWGKPSYQLPQFIHISGTLLAQLTPDNSILLLANRLAGPRRAVSKFDRTTEYVGPGRMGLHVDAVPGDMGSPSSGSKDTASAAENETDSAESVAAALERFCHDKSALETLYRSVRGSKTGPEVVVPPMDLNG